MKKSKQPGDQQVAFAKTNVPNLYRHKSGTYYSRVTLDGKRQFRSLFTNLKGVAVIELKKQENLVAAQRLNTSSQLEERQLRTFADCLIAYRQRVFNMPNQQQATRDYKLVGLKVVERTWPVMDEYPRNIGIDLVYKWLQLMESNVGYKAPGAKRTSHKSGSKVSNSSYNRNLLALREILDLAVEYGLCVKNVARDESIRQRKYNPKAPALPSAEQFNQLVAHLQKSPLPVHREASFFIQFCAYTGARLSTAGSMTWDCVQPDALLFKQLKGAVDRRPTVVPMNPSAKKLLEEIRQARGTVQAGDKVFLIKECQRTLDAACQELKMARLTHHDLRHLFTTRCIEAGIDIPTISRWLCHQDGGALLMKTYGHLRDEHSQAMAAKVKF